MGKKEVVDPRQQLITKFFQVKDAEEMGKDVTLALPDVTCKNITSGNMFRL